MPSRIRLNKTPFTSNGFAERWNSGVLITREEMTPTEAITYPYESHRCDDVVNERHKDNPLLITFEGRQAEPLNGHLDVVPGSTWRHFQDYIPRVALQSPVHATGISTSIPSVGVVATATLARSNPSKPYVSVPNFLYELKDLPGMIRDIGNFKRQAMNIRKKGLQQVTAKNAASHLLSYQMGWSPLIGDLRKLLDFQAQVDKKLRELQNLYNNGGLQRRVRLPEWKSTSFQRIKSNFSYESAITSLLTWNYEVFSTIERWGTVRWYPSHLPDSRYSSRQMADLARNLTFGMNRITAKQLWDAIPWTWLVGWFSNADEFLQAHSNAIPLTHSTPCVMTKTESKISWIRTDTQGWAKGGNGAMGYTTKRRQISSGTLSATIPFLNGRQLSILGALAIQRKR